MKTTLAVSIGLALSLPLPAAAHRLDEFLQASRLSLTSDGVALEIDLTPGANTASEVSRLIDTDGDGALSAVEAEAYARRVVADIALEADGHSVSLRLTGVQAPTIDDMAAGVGTIRVTAVGDRPDRGPGRVRLRYRNNHHEASSVYLVNALMPRDGSIAVAAQARDPQQREIQLEFDVKATSQPRLAWLIVGVLVVAGLVVLRQG